MRLPSHPHQLWRDCNAIHRACQVRVLVKLPAVDLVPPCGPTPTFAYDGVSSLSRLEAARLKAGRSYKEVAMPTYITIANLTDQGIRNMKDLSRRLQNAEQQFAQMGAELKEVYLLMGQFDYIVIAEAPDDETMARITLAVAGQGNVRTQTTRAFNREEMLRVVEGLP